MVESIWAVAAVLMGLLWFSWYIFCLRLVWRWRVTTSAQQPVDPRTTLDDSRVKSLGWSLVRMLYPLPERRVSDAMTTKSSPPTATTEPWLSAYGENRLSLGAPA